MFEGLFEVLYAFSCRSCRRKEVMHNRIYRFAGYTT